MQLGSLPYKVHHFSVTSRMKQRALGRNNTTATGTVKQKTPGLNDTEINKKITDISLLSIIYFFFFKKAGFFPGWLEKLCLIIINYSTIFGMIFFRNVHQYRKTEKYFLGVKTINSYTYLLTYRYNTPNTRGDAPLKAHHYCSLPQEWDYFLQHHACRRKVNAHGRMCNPSLTGPILWEGGVAIYSEKSRRLAHWERMYPCALSCLLARRLQGRLHSFVWPAPQTQMLPFC